MKTKTLSGPAVFMYSVIAVVTVLSLICFYLYYTATCLNSFVLWTGIVSFMILYHFGLRIFFGNVTKHFTINYNNFWFRQHRFERKLYKFLRVKQWKNKVLTFDPEAFNLKKHSLEEIAATMTKSELDHWINEIISVASIFFVFIWGCLPAFVISAAVAFLFDAQFIVVQRYNRPLVLRLIERKRRKSGDAH